MRVEPYSVGSYLHIIKRGARGMPITGDEADKARFLRLLYYMNDEFFSVAWDSLTAHKPLGYRAAPWPERIPLVSILGYTLMPNHFHLLVRENKEGGTSCFMQKLGQSMTNFFNSKYKQQGSIFQGSYRSRTINSDAYFQYVVAYVLVKNTFELYPRGGLAEGQRNFAASWKWALHYPYSSLGDFMNGASSPILDKAAIDDIIKPQKTFEMFARDVIEGGKWKNVEFE